jgi:hypothetical protein
MPFILFLTIHASVAAFLSVLLRLDWWWGLIQFCFPLLIYFSILQSLPTYFYLLTFFLLSILFWSTFSSQVPYYPSNAALKSPILNLISRQQNIKFIDIGSGMGGLIIDLAECRKDCQFWGIEIAPLPWLVSVFRTVFYHSNAHFKLGNYNNLHLSTFDVVFCYLSPAAMPDLWSKVKAEMRPNTLLLSYEFIIPDIKPDLCIEIADDAPFLYGWRL